MKKLFNLSIVFICISIILTGCSKSVDKEGDSSDITKVHWMSILHTPSAPSDEVIEKLEELTNSEIDFTWIPDASKDERITTSLASGELADIVTITLLKNSAVRNAMKSGVFWDIEDYLDEFPNLSKISQERLDMAKVGGKLYGVPIQKPLARSGFVIRKDWLDNLGLEAPTNLEELMEVARAFTEDDPDGNGKDDTYAIADRSDLRYSSFKLISAIHKAPNDWGIDENGKFIPEFASKEYMEALKYQREMYEKGYINKDFAVTAKQEQQQMFAQGKSGIYTGLIDIANLRNQSQGLQEGLELLPINKIGKTADDTDYRIWSEGNGVHGVLAFPKAYVKTEERLKEILGFVDNLMDEDPYLLMTYGIEGKHWEWKGETPEIIDYDLWQQDAQAITSSRPSDIAFHYPDANPEKDLANELIIENDKWAVFNEAMPYDSKTYNERGSELEKIMIDASIQFIMGKIDEDGYQQALNDWYEKGGNDIVSEYEEQYKEINQ